MPCGIHVWELGNAQEIVLAHLPGDNELTIAQLHETCLNTIHGSSEYIK